MTTRTNTTLVSSHARDATATAALLLVIAGSLFIALTAQVAVYIGPVPVSGQTLGVLLVGALLGTRKGVAAVALYIGEGLAGMPVFAGGRAGVVVLAGPTGGYLVGFLAAAAIAGYLAESGMDRRPSTAFLAMGLASLAIYIPGVLWLSRFTGWESVLAAGVYPFLAGDLVKTAIAALALPLGWSVLRHRRGS